MAGRQQEETEQDHTDDPPHGRESITRGEEENASSFDMIIEGRILKRGPLPVHWSMSSTIR